MDYFAEYDYDSVLDDISMVPTYDSEILIAGDANSPPTVSTPMQSSTDSPFSRLLDFMGSIGTTARDLGTAIGKTERDLKIAKGEYKTARQNALTGNTIGTWWQYASMTDKLVVGLAVAGVVVGVYAAVKK